MTIDQLLAFTFKNKASDLHVSSGEVPHIRVNGELRALDMELLSSEHVERLLSDVMNPAMQAEFKKRKEIDFSFELQDVARFRVNIFMQNRGVAAAFRMIPENILTLEDLQLPPILKEICEYPSGLVLMTGPTGSGKSTTLAAMIDNINRSKRKHILTIEDPIEYVHKSNKSLINQRELNTHTHSFSNALRAGLREDPDIILVGEMRDLETMRLALSAAETGHLVFATLHTMSAAKTIHRIIDAFPGDEKDMIRTILSETLRAVVAQTLVSSSDGGRVAAMELLISNSAVRNLIRENKIAQMYSAMQTGSSEGMMTLDQHLMQLLDAGKISQEVVAHLLVDKEQLAAKTSETGELSGG